MFRVLAFLGVALTVGGFLNLIIELIGALSVVRMPAWYLPLWIIVTIVGIVLMSIAGRRSWLDKLRKHPELSSPATVTDVTFARHGSEDENYYNIDLVVQPEGKPTYAYRHHRSLSPGELLTWKPGHVVAVRRIYGSKDEMRIDMLPPKHTRERIQNEKEALSRVRTADLKFSETSTPGPAPSRWRAAKIAMWASVLLGIVLSLLTFPRFVPMVAESTVGSFFTGANHRGLFAEGALADAADRISPYLDDEIYRVEIDGNYKLTVWEVADIRTEKLDVTAIRGDRIYGPAPLSYRPSSIEAGELFDLDDLNWDVLPDALDVCEERFDDPSASRETLTANAYEGEITWSVSYYGDYGSFSCTILTSGEVISG